MSRKVKFVRFQTSVHFPDAGELGFTVPGSKVLPGLDMTCMGGDGVNIKFSWQGKSHEVWIPSSNIVLAQLEEDNREFPKPFRPVPKA